MRIFRCFLAVATLIACFFALIACQPTPEEPIVVSKGDGKLRSTIYGSPAPLGKFSAPNMWQEQIDASDKKLKICVDATVDVPNVEAYPVYRVTPLEITSEAANRFISAFLGAEELYRIEDRRTKDVIAAEILDIQNECDNPQSLINQQYASGMWTKAEYDSQMDSFAKQITALQEEYFSAPAKMRLTPIQKEFVDAVVFQNTLYIRYTALQMMQNGWSILLRIQTAAVTLHCIKQNTFVQIMMGMAFLWEV